MIGGFDGAWTSRLGDALTVTTRVTVGGADLDVISGSVTWNEDRTPHVQATLQCRVPDDLDALDPRQGVRVAVEAGYAVPGASESRAMADLMLTARTVRRPDNLMEITAVSDEQKVLDTQPIAASRTYGPTSDGGAAIRDLILWGAPDAAVEVTAHGTFVASGDTLVIDREDNLWNAIQDIADRIGAWVYHDGLTGFHVVPQPLNAGPARAQFRTGPGGTITRSESQLSREAFGNTVVVKYSWYDGTQRTAFGWAEVTSGPYAVAAVGRKVLTVEVERKGTAAQAQAAATAMVRRAITRGRSLSFEFEHAPLWVRPGDTVTVQLPTGEQDRHIVSRLDIDIPNGTGHITTRRPEDVTTESGE